MDNENDTALAYNLLEDTQNSQEQSTYSVSRSFAISNKPKNELFLYGLLMNDTPNNRKEQSTYSARRSMGIGNRPKALAFQDESSFETPKNIGGISKLSSHSVNRTATPKLMESFISQSDLNTSHFGNLFETNLTMDITTDVTVTTAVLLAEEDPGLQATTSLYQDFLDLYQSYPGEHESFHLLLEYENLCSSNVELLMKIMRKAAPAQHKFSKTVNVLRILQEERNTWRLLRILYQDRLEVENVEEGEILMDTLGKKVSDKQIIENLYQRNAFIRQSQLVVDWLEKNAADDFPDTYIDKLEYFFNHSVSWEHTLHDLQSQKSDLDRPTKSLLITEMDPDAPIRQKNFLLHDIDKEAELRLLKQMFVSMRAGHLAEAQKFAEKYGQPWLSAALEGWRLYHDPNYDNESVQGETLKPVEGNPYRDIWKAACWRLSQEPRIPVYEQAMYAALSGNLKALLPACMNWEDHLWAYVRVLVDKRIEQELHSSTQQERPLEELPSTYWDKILDMKQVFHELQASQSEDVKREGMSHHHIMQKFIILDDLDGLIEELYNWSHCNPPPTHHLMRFMAHLILFLRVVGRSSKEELCVSIIEAYVKELIEERRIPLVAAYTSTLPAAQQVMWYAKFLEGITDNTERQQCLQYAEEAGLNVPLITKTVVENMRAKETAPGGPHTTLTTETTEEDKQKIEAIDWLVFDPSQRAEAMKQANALMRVFVASKKLDAARQVFSKIPTDSLDVMIRQWRRITGNTELSAEDDNAAREYLCFQAYLQAYDAFNDWFEHFQHAKPEYPEPPAGDHVKFTERVAHEHQVKQYESDLERWENVLWAQTKTTTDRLYNVLLFINGGWMVDQRTDGVIDETRQMQMSLLRKLCIPQICFLLHSVLHSTNQHKECIQIADIISSEKNQLYREFSMQELRNFLSTLREASLVLLDQGCDPLGYPFQ